MKCKTTGMQRGCDGFTLIELLVVIMIIMILSAILMPAIITAIGRSESTGGEAFLYKVSLAAGSYHSDHQYYPGQYDSGQLTGSPGSSGERYTGSEILAARLCGYPVDDIDRNVPRAGGVDAENKLTMYLEYKSTYVFKWSGRGNCLYDGVSGPRPLLYYPYRLGADPEIVRDCYEWDDNRVYVTDPDDGGSDFFYKEDNNYAKDERVSLARNPGGFLLIGAGLNRKYFEPLDTPNDDHKSWEAR